LIAGQLPEPSPPTPQRWVASIGHADASTEAGVGFAMNNGLEGLPGSVLTVDAGSTA